MHGESGSSLVEVLAAAAIAATVSAGAIPGLLAGLDGARTNAATRYVVARLNAARADALKRSADVGLQFVADAAGYRFQLHADGNRNGLRTREIARGIDVPVGPPERLADNFPGVEFGALPGIPAAVAGGTAPGTDPIRLGSSELLTFSPGGTASPGTVYLRGRRAQCAIVVLGATGRVRALSFNPTTRRWLPL